MGKKIQTTPPTSGVTPGPGVLEVAILQVWGVKVVPTGWTRVTRCINCQMKRRTQFRIIYKERLGKWGRKRSRKS